MTALVRGYTAGLTADDDTLGVQAILDAGAGGNYLRARHTLKHCRGAARPDIFVADPLDTWQNAGAPDLYERAAAKYRELRQGLAPLDLPEDTVRDLEKIVQTADAALVQ